MYLIKDCYKNQSCFHTKHKNKKSNHEAFDTSWLYCNYFC